MWNDPFFRRRHIKAIDFHVYLLVYALLWNAYVCFGKKETQNSFP